MSKEFDYLIFIGRFQPLHLGHEKVIKTALKKSKKTIVLVGSANVAPSIRNPFDYSFREESLKRAFPDAFNSGSLIVEPLDDNIYNDTAWIAYTQNKVKKIIVEDANESVILHGLNDFKVGLIGASTDGTSYYLKLFPNWESINVEPDPVKHAQYGNRKRARSTDVRFCYFTKDHKHPYHLYLDAVLSNPVREMLEAHRGSKEYLDYVEELKFIVDYQRQWKDAPYDPTFVTVDAVVIQSGHVLLVQRAHNPGKGLWALPGGFVDVGERLIKSAVRELKEETRISDAKGEIPPAMLESYIDDSKTRVFDHPNRSERGRTITHAFYFDLPDKRNLFKVKGDSDAKESRWFKLGTIDARTMFEDHWFIIREMTGI